MEEEVRQILREVVETTAPKAINKGFGSRIHHYFARSGGSSWSYQSGSTHHQPLISTREAISTLP